MMSGDNHKIRMYISQWSREAIDNIIASGESGFKTRSEFIRFYISDGIQQNKKYVGEVFSRPMVVRNVRRKIFVKDILKFMIKHKHDLNSSWSITQGIDPGRKRNIKSTLLRMVIDGYLRNNGLKLLPIVRFNKSNEKYVQRVSMLTFSITRLGRRKLKEMEMN